MKLTQLRAVLSNNVDVNNTSSSLELAKPVLIRLLDTLIANPDLAQQLAIKMSAVKS